MSMFKKATRKRVFMKLALTGPSGSGKTFSGLQLARGLAGPDGRIAVLDTENDSASLYSHHVDFDTISIGAPFTVQRYVDVIEAAVAEGYNVLLIDSLSHAWAAEGGLLSQKEALDSRPNSNSFTNWATITKQQERFKSALLQTPIHIISTMRSKQEYLLETGNGGKATPKKVGMAPIQRDDMAYEFSTIFDIGMGHDAFVSKDRTGLFDGVVGTLSAKHGQQIKEWLESGAEPDPVLTSDTASIVTSANTSTDKEYNNLLSVLANVACNHGLGERILTDGKPSRTKMYDLVALLLDAEPFGKEEAPTLGEISQAIEALPAYVRSKARPEHTSQEPQEKQDKFPPRTPAPTPTAEAKNEETSVKPGASPNQCGADGCTNMLTPSQLTMSQNKFGRPLCLKHQKDATLTAGGKPSAPATPSSPVPEPKDTKVPADLADMEDPFADDATKEGTPYAGAGSPAGAI